MSNQKICTFYVSELHLLTIILPYINEKIEEKQNILILSEKDITNSVKKYLESLTSFYEDEILDLNWRKFNKKITEEDLTKKEVFVIGKNNFIEKVNSKLESKNIEKIINCYYINKLEDLDSVPKEYEYILKTSGISKIEKNSQNIQKRKTVKSQ